MGTHRPGCDRRSPQAERPHVCVSKSTCSASTAASRSLAERRKSNTPVNSSRILSALIDMELAQARELSSMHSRICCVDHLAAHVTQAVLARHLIAIQHVLSDRVRCAIRPARYMADSNPSEID